MYARACCTCNRAVRTDNMILKGPVQSFTHHSSLLSKLINNYCHRILHDQPGHLLPDHQHPVNQPARLLGQDNMITVVPRLPGQSSFTPVAPRTCTKQPGGSHAVYMWLQSRHLVRQLDMDGFHRRFTNVSVYQIRMQTAPAVSSHEA